MLDASMMKAIREQGSAKNLKWKGCCLMAKNKCLYRIISLNQIYYAFLHLTLLCCMLIISSSDLALEYPPSSPAKISKSIPTATIVIGRDQSDHKK